MSEFTVKANHRDDATGWRRLGLASALVVSVALLPSCSVWDWTKNKFSSPPPVVQAPAPAPEPVPPPPPPAAPVVPMPAPSLPPAPTPIMPPPPMTAMPLVAEPPRAAMPVPAPRAAPAAPASGIREGRYAVQVGVFLVAANAETIRTRVAAQLADEPSLADGERVVRSVKKGERTHVVVGDVADRRAAETLAVRLRTVLRQDVAVFQR